MARPYVRHTAKIEGDFVVFLIGARLAKPWLFWKIIPVARAMIAMVKELEAHPELGFLGQEQWPGRTGIQVQYWRSRDHLMAYARNRDNVHLPAWRRFNQITSKGNAVGIWHETYLVRANEYECIYGNMPLFGLAKAAQRIDVAGRDDTAHGRLGVSDGTDAPDGVEIPR
jgi:Domain of unknown function (DUF4188)